MSFEFPIVGRIEVTGGFLLLMAWLNYTDTQGLLVPAMTAAAAHELGHWVAIRLFGGQVVLLQLSAVGARMELRTPLSYRREVICALAGPGVNLALAIVCAGRGSAEGWLYSGLNLAMGCFNLLPVSGLDGGRAVNSLVSFWMGQERAFQVGYTLDLTLSFLLIAAGSAVLWAGGNVTLLLAALWIYAGTKKSYGKKGLSRNVGTGKMGLVKERG